MIFLNRIYSETGLFDEVVFEKGINIILGKYSGDKESKDVNGIGKSTLVRLIDFAFLAETDKSHFDVNKNTFLKEQNVVLELSIDKKVYSITRSFDDPKKVTFGEAGKEKVEYSISELRNVLGKRFFTEDEYDGVVENKWFRQLIKFFVKDDMEHNNRKEPFNFIHGALRMPVLITYNFYLANLKNKHVFEFDKTSEEVFSLRKIKSDLEKRIFEDTGKTAEEYKSELSSIDLKIKMLEDAVKDFKFAENYKDIEKTLIELSGKISDRLRTYNSLKRRLEELRNSYKYEFEIDVEKVRKIYKDVNEVFSEIVKKTFDEVMDFRKAVVENRKTFLANRELKISGEIDTILSQISELEIARSSNYKLLQENKALDGLKNTYSKLVTEKSEKEKRRLTISQIQECEKNIASLNVKITKLVQKLLSDVEEGSGAITKLRDLFMDILKNSATTDEEIDASFDISARANNLSPVKISVDIPKSQSFAKSKFKIFAYDLTIFLNLIDEERKLPNFLIHDGVFHGLGRITMTNVLNYIYSKCLIYPNMQYILTLNEDEVEISAEKQKTYGKYNFNWKDLVIATYEDVPEKMIFKREYK